VSVGRQADVFFVELSLVELVEPKNQTTQITSA
jgi:hypothetical protein